MNSTMTASAAKSVHYYRATAIECCDRCGQVIKNVAIVTFKDGTVQRYGMDCIEKVLANLPDLKSLFKKNLKLLVLYRAYAAILAGPVADMPRGSEYYGSGLYFIGDGMGKDIAFGGHFFFHPECTAKCMSAIAADLPKLNAEIERLDGFLARVLTKAAAVAKATV